MGAGWWVLTIPLERKVWTIDEHFDQETFWSLLEPLSGILTE